MRSQSTGKPLFIGLVLGLVFGCADLALTWLRPLTDDSPFALLGFYGPMFLTWSIVAFSAARRAGRWRSGLMAGMVVAFATFVTFVAINFLRVNLFLHELTARGDWVGLMARFRASRTKDLRLFVNVDYLRGTPFKVAAATAFGAVFGSVGGVLGWLMRTRAGSRTA